MWLLLTVLACGDDPAAKRVNDTAATAAPSTGSTPTGTTPPGATSTGTTSAGTTPSGTTPSGGHTGDTALPDPGHSVLVVIIDDVGIDQLATYDQAAPPVPTPNLDALASRGVQFQHAYAHPTCTPTRAALLTGQYAMRHDLGDWLQPNTDEVSLDPDAVVLPEVVRLDPNHDWADAAVGKWHLVSFVEDPDPPTHPLRVGFSHYRGGLANPAHRLMGEPGKRDYFEWEKSVDGVMELSNTYMTTDTADEAIAMMATLPEPWLLYVAFNAAHVPLHVPPSHLHAEPISDPPTDVEQYRAMAAALDTELGRVFEAAATLPRGELTTIVVGDNGTPSHGIQPPLDPDRSKGTLFEGGVRVPLWVDGPAVTRPGSVSRAPVHVVDVLPTVAEIAGVDPGALTTTTGAPLLLDGASLLPFVRDPDAGSARPIYSAKSVPNGPAPWSIFKRTVRDEAHKLVVYTDGSRRLFQVTDAVDEGADLGRDEMGDLEREAFDRLSAELEAIESTF